MHSIIFQAFQERPYSNGQMMHTILMALICFIAVGVGSLICQVVSVSRIALDSAVFKNAFLNTLTCEKVRNIMFIVTCFRKLSLSLSSSASPIKNLFRVPSQPPSQRISCSSSASCPSDRYCIRYRDRLLSCPTPSPEFLVLFVC